MDPCSPNLLGYSLVLVVQTLAVLFCSIILHVLISTTEVRQRHCTYTVRVSAVRLQDSGRQYKTFKGLEADLEPPEYKGKPGRTIHLWLGNIPLTSLSAHRNPDGSYSGTMALKSGGAPQHSATAPF